MNTFETIRGYIDQYAEEKQLEVKVDHFSNGLLISDSYRPEYDIVLMDVDMPLMNGISAAKIIREKDPEVIIIFITNLSQYAIQGYSVQAYDYILKPIKYFSFIQFFDRAVTRLRKNSTQPYITISMKEGLRKVAISDLYYIEVQNHTLSYHTASGTFQATGKMKELESSLHSHHFSRCNNSYLVNLAYVDCILENDAVVHGEPLPVSRSRKKDFSSALISYISTHLK
ncbi:MAG: response regulator transcription factor [Parasporobacterium sp.]|nr:response regulator transcription factor [Parasporobacterium sp.]